MQHFLASRQAVDIPIKHLYVEYRHWIDRDRPFGNVEEELATLRDQGANFRRVLVPEKSDPIYNLATFMESFDVRTAYPLLLHLLALDLPHSEWESLSTTLESYLLRRAVLGWTTKAYNRIFLNLIKALQKEGAPPAPMAIAAALSELSGESSAWPKDEAFTTAWMNRPVYEDLNNAKLTHALVRLNDTYMTRKAEELTIESDLTVEHIMPQSWLEHWPLADGQSGMTWREVIDAAPDDPRSTATTTRDRIIHTFGNLTIVTQSLNSAVKNGEWVAKKSALLEASLLPINQQLHTYVEWNEDVIAQRGKEMLRRALEIWPGPQLRGA